MLKKYIKRFIYFCIAVLFVIAGAWVAGTFNPNQYTVQKIEDEFHKKEMKITETKLCRSASEGMNLMATKALYRLFTNIPLQIQQLLVPSQTV